MTLNSTLYEAVAELEIRGVDVPFGGYDLLPSFDLCF